uniref:Putative ribonuclease H-like domain-containing protein n=1 Tax=Tanacetum cinerariifolium TaxID=118510 RepID=A0A699K4K7_TANCI|nr:putative ribonuclease H-like domain-containing protein [Tanacetum cinerariifolium]
MNSVSKDHVKPKVLAPGKYAIDVEPIVPRLRNNREAHLDYLRHLKESVETIREIVKEAKVVRPLDSSIVSACRYTKHSQKLLEYAIGTCRQDSHQQDKKHSPAPLIRKKQVTFAEQKSKKHTYKPKTENTNVEVLNTLHMDLYGPMRVSKYETPEVVIKFLQQIQVGLIKIVRYIRTDNGTKFINKTLTKYYERIGIFHQKTVPRTPQQNGVVERRNRTLVEAARIMLIFFKAPMFLWAEAMATACYTQN